MTERFTTTLDCDIGFIPDASLDELPIPSQIGATRVRRVDLSKPRIRATHAAVPALTAAPDGFTVADLAAEVHAMTEQTNTTYTTCQAGYDLRGKHLVDKPGRSRRLPGPRQIGRAHA